MPVNTEKEIVFSIAPSSFVNFTGDFIKKMKFRSHTTLGYKKKHSMLF